ncbi:efflux transporter outer membrane subunit [Pseudoalteromonas sp. ASV78]|uniref:efflux transporter outer membrane subunit n=1 Tax=Pseudoalteromonas sp. ASV78 TaxID=3397851 RepID=UPI0039FBCFF1
MQFKNLFAMFSVVSITTGCAVGPDYTKPVVPMMESYSEQIKVTEHHAISSVDLHKWWKEFNDPQLTRFITLALANNLDLAQAFARVEQVRASLGAANAALLPSGNISGQATRAYQSLDTPLAQVLNSTTNFDRYGNSYEVNLNAGWELDLFAGLRRGREAALADYQASEAGVAATRLAVAAQTADIYITIRGLQSRLDVAQRQVQTQQELLAIIKLLYNKGLAAELEVRQVEGALAMVQASVPVLETGLDAAMNALDVMLGAPPGTYRAELTDMGVIPIAPMLVDMGTPRDLLRRRPDLIMAERQLAAANARIGVAMAEYYPKLSLNGLLGSATSLSGGNLFSHSANQATGLLGLRWRLFDFGRIDAQIGQAKGQEAETLAAYRLAVLRASEDVENALSMLVNRELQTNILTQGVDSLSRARKASFSAYQQGVVSLIEVLQADENLLRAEDLYTQSKISSAQAAVATFKALGGGWQPDTEHK